MANTRPQQRRSTASGSTFTGRCACGAVEITVEYPAFWAWHDHSQASRRAHGAAYATYVGCWRKKVRVAKGQKSIARYEDTKAGTARSFCSRCGTPLIYERARSKGMINLPRALFAGRTGREPRYHMHVEERPDWAYREAKLVPLKGFPGVVWERPKSRKKARDDAFPDFPASPRSSADTSAR